MVADAENVIHGDESAVLVAHEHEHRRFRRAVHYSGRAAVRGERFEAGIERRHALRIRADDVRIDEERLLEQLSAITAQVANLVLAVHENIGADLKFGEHAEARVDLVRARAAAGDDLGIVASGAKLFDHSLQVGRAFFDGGAAVGVSFDVLLRAAIELDAGEAERAVAGDALGERDGRFRRGHAGAANAGIDIDDDRQRPAGFMRCVGERIDVVGVIGDDHQIADALVQGDETGNRLRRYDGRGNQDGVDAAVRQRFGFTQFGAADAQGAGGHLQAPDLDALVRLRVRTQREAVLPGERCHRRDVAFKRIAIDDKHGRAERGARALLADEVAVEVEVAHSAALAAAWPANNAPRCSFRNLPAGSCFSRTARKRVASG